MIDIKILKDESSYDISIKGHAGYEEIGKDIYCAAASTLFLTLDACICKHPFVTHYSSEIAPGRSRLSFEYSDKSVNTIISTIEVGLRSLAMEYPEYYHIVFLPKKVFGN